MDGGDHKSEMCAAIQSVPASFSERGMNDKNDRKVSLLRSNVLHLFNECKVCSSDKTRISGLNDLVKVDALDKVKQLLKNADKHQIQLDLESMKKL